MQKTPPPYHRHLSRQYSFSHLQEITLPLHTKPLSHFKPTLQPAKNRDDRRTASPLHNLHYKYLPEDYISPEKARDGKDKSKEKGTIIKENDSRTQGIQKINSKIKNILESIEKQQKRKEIYVEKYSIDLNPPITHFNERSTPKIQHFRESQRTIEKDYSHHFNTDYKTPLKDKNMNHIEKSNHSQYSNLSSIKNQKQSPYYSKGRENLKDSSSQLKLSMHFQEKEENSSYNLMNSRYHTYSVSRIKKSKQNQSVVIKGKNVDNQIDRIQLKIQQLQKVKKNMNIDFSSSKVEETGQESRDKMESTQQESKISHMTSLKSSFIQSFARNNQSQIKEELLPKRQEKVAAKQSDMAKSEFFTPQPNQKINQQDVPLPKLLRNLTNKKKKENTQKPPPTDFNQIQSSVSQFFNTNTQTPQSLETNRQITTPSFAQAVNAAVTGLAGEGQSHSHGKTEVKRLLENLENQIRLDEQLRKSKKWFQRMRKQTKWQDLEAVMKISSLWEGAPSMKTSFSITSQEQNPFYTPRQSDFTISTLVQSFQQSQKHWKKAIVRGYSSSALQRSGFSEQSIDISKRGVISIEDLVRYINYQLDTFYRNRDVYLIYHRFKQTQLLRFKEILQCLSQ